MARTNHQAFNGANLLLDEGFRTQFITACRLLRDERVSPLKFLVPMLLALYVASPIDAIPDVFLGFGQIDDLGIAVIALMLFVRIMPWVAPAEVVAEHAGGRQRASAASTRSGETTGDVVEAGFRIRE